MRQTGSSVSALLLGHRVIPSLLKHFSIFWQLHKLETDNILELAQRSTNCSTLCFSFLLWQPADRLGPTEPHTCSVTAANRAPNRPTSIFPFTHSSSSQRRGPAWLHLLYVFPTKLNFLDLETEAERGSRNDSWTWSLNLPWNIFISSDTNSLLALLKPDTFPGPSVEAPGWMIGATDRFMNSLQDVSSFTP